MNTNNFFLKKEDTAFLLIDVQEKLFAAIPDEQRTLVGKNCRILLEVAGHMHLPLIVSEQYPKGLGQTVGGLMDLLEGIDRLPKIYFDCMKDPALHERLSSLPEKNIVIAGIEAHVCVFQTALSLLNNNRNVIIASDAVASRRLSDKDSAVETMRSAGALVYSTETISFMLLEKAGTLEFKTLSKLFK
jgi:nicotinamidase-related amidase